MRSKERSQCFRYSTTSRFSSCPTEEGSFGASASVCEVKLEIGEYPPVFLDENSAAGSAAQGFQAVGTCPGKEIEHGFLLDKVA